MSQWFSRLRGVRVRNVRRIAGTAVAVAALVAVSGLVALSAPGQHAPDNTSTANRAAPQHTLAPASTSSTTAQIAPGSTAPVPTKTPKSPKTTGGTGGTTQSPAQLDTATATPTTPPPTATATPAPSWHTLGSYSGTGPGAITTLTNVPGPMQVVWTCDPASGVANWTIGFRMVSSADTMATGQRCQAGSTSGTFNFDIPASEYGLNWDVSCVDSGDGGGSWTATIQAWY